MLSPELLVFAFIAAGRVTGLVFVGPVLGTTRGIAVDFRAVTRVVASPTLGLTLAPTGRAANGRRTVPFLCGDVAPRRFLAASDGTV